MVLINFNDNLSIICAAICVLIAACQGSDRVTVDRGVKAPRMMRSSLSCSDNLMSEEELLFHGYHSNSRPSTVRGRAGRTHLLIPPISCSMPGEVGAVGVHCLCREVPRMTVDVIIDYVPLPLL